MLTHPIVRIAAVLLAAGALTAGPAPVVLAQGAQASVQRHGARLVIDRVEDRFEQAVKAQAARAAADSDDARMADKDEARDMAREKAEEQAEARERAMQMAQAQAIRARIEAAEQAAMARAAAREAQIKALIASLQQMH